MPNPASIQLPPNSTGSLVGTWQDAGGKHYHGFIPVTQDGIPVRDDQQWALTAELLLGVCRRLDILNSQLMSNYSPPDTLGI